ncbi:hypothetical protein M378DRAFT_171424 [Amanita muscaria Koide BX008]|uniref:Uncharacterized protein n=1 Tax=Amanita muscaria (strain Koide BX008) TaxID=946122 RepID=A0A0C2WLZ3_AMAMK|nr:hypothetical protein M378DRAFT_171424 [Amanita muscaria Koide BX008]
MKLNDGLKSLPQYVNLFQRGESVLLRSHKHIHTFCLVTGRVQHDGFCIPGVALSSALPPSRIFFRAARDQSFPFEALPVAKKMIPLMDCFAGMQRSHRSVYASEILLSRVSAAHV